MRAAFAPLARHHVYHAFLSSLILQINWHTLIIGRAFSLQTDFIPALYISLDYSENLTHGI